MTSATRDSVAVESYVYTGPHNARSVETRHSRGVDGREYVYDAEDRLVAAGNTTFAYDVDGF